MLIEELFTEKMMNLICRSLIFNKLINYGNWILNERIPRKYMQKKNRKTKQMFGFFEFSIEDR